MTNNKFVKIALFLLAALIIIAPAEIVRADDSTNTATNLGTNIITLLPIVGPLAVPFGTIETGMQYFTNIPNPQTVVAGTLSGFVLDGISSFAGMIATTIYTYLMTVGHDLLNWSINVPIVSATDLTSNTIVSTGWNLVRNLANAVLVIGLVVIAISIILGYEEGKAKKTLINFIIIALLINFTPVICGFIIDGSDIIMKGIINGGGVHDSLQTGILAAGNDIQEIKGDTPSRLMGDIAIIVIAVVSFVIYGLYSLLFLARHLVLWLLVIASPIAFATKVLPPSKYIRKIFPSIAYWDDWWENFLQWCVIGIPAAFTIYLSNGIADSLVYTTPTGQAALTTKIFTASIIGELFNFSIPLIFLIAGFFITVSSGGQIGSFVGGLATGLWAGTGAKALQTTKEWAIGGAKRTATGAAGGALIAADQINKEGFTTENVLGAVPAKLAVGTLRGAFTTTGREEGTKRLTLAGEKMGMVKRGAYEADLNKRVGDEAKRQENLPVNDLRATANMTALTKSQADQKAGAIMSLTKRGLIDDTDIKNIVANKQSMQSIGVNLKEIAKARPDRAIDLTGDSPAKIIGDMNPKKAGETIHSAAYSDEAVITTVAGSNPKILEGKINKGNKEDIDNIREGYIKMLNKVTWLGGQKIDKNNLKDFVNNNRTLIDNEIKQLKNSTKPEDVEKARALVRLSENARLGKL